MASESGVTGGVLLVPGSDWRRIFGLVWLLCLATIGVLLLDSYAIARIEWWLPIESFQDAAWYSLFVTTLSEWVRYCIIGVGVFVAFNALRSDGGRARAGKFLGFWCLVSLFLAFSFMAVDLVLQQIQFLEEPIDNLIMRWIWLGSVYVRILLLYVAARFLLGAMAFTGGDSDHWGATWRATTMWQSIGFAFGLLALKLIVDGVFVNVVSYLPFVSPFWFIPNEMSPMRDLVARGAWIIAQGLGVFIYVAFFVSAGRRLARSEATPAPS